MYTYTHSIMNGTNMKPHPTESYTSTVSYSTALLTVWYASPPVNMEHCIARDVHILRARLPLLYCMTFMCH